METDRGGTNNTLSLCGMCSPLSLRKLQELIITWVWLFFTAHVCPYSLFSFTIKKCVKKTQGVCSPDVLFPGALLVPITTVGRESSTGEPEKRHKKMNKEPVLMQMVLVTVITLIKRKAAHHGLVTGDAL